MISKDHFLGSWKAQRKWVNLSSGEELFFQGIGVFSKKEMELYLFSEKGHICTEKKPAYYQEYFFDFSQEGLCSVLFPSKKLFFTLCLNDSHQDITHNCKQDRYQGHFFFKETFWNLSWKVQGPKKNYLLDCCYEKLP